MGARLMQMFQTIARTMKPRETLKIQCDACGHRVSLSYAAAAAACGPDSTPADVRRRARCKVCGVEGRVRVWI